MSKVCSICGKGPTTGCNVSHSNRHTKRRWMPNIQKVRAIVDGKTKQIRVCTRCIRSGKVIKPGPFA